MPPQRPPYALGPGRGLRRGIHSPELGGVAQIGNNNVEGGSPARGAARRLRPPAGRRGGAAPLGLNRVPMTGRDSRVAPFPSLVWGHLGYNQEVRPLKSACLNSHLTDKLRPREGKGLSKVTQ